MSTSRQPPRMKPAPMSSSPLSDATPAGAGAIVRMAAPSRLHFGMFSFGVPGTRQFGGVGAMIETPFFGLFIQPAEQLRVTTRFEADVRVVVQRLVESGLLTTEPPCLIDVVTDIPRHVGLGSGTQLALAVAAGLNFFLGRPAMAVEDLARATGRGRRSAIGLHGFAQGGLLAEAGKLTPEEISPLAERAHLPQRWRFVLLRPRGEIGLSGEAERRAFDKLPPVPHERTDKLQRLARETLIPAAAAGDFHRFSRALFEFNHEAGMCFAAQQDGAYASQRVRRIVEHVRALGIEGVAQTSWGPTVAALLPDLPAAEAFASQMQADDLEITIAAPNNRGALVSV